MSDQGTGNTGTPSLPRDRRRLEGLDWEVRAAVFRHLYGTGAPMSTAELEHALGADPAAVSSSVQRLERTGRLRRNDSGEIVTAGGISLEETPHRIITHRGPRWTNCAYDALGILAATGEGEVITSSPLSGTIIRVGFHGGLPEPTDAALFLADASCCDSFIDEWCPNVNLFEDRSSAERWGRERGLTGTIVSVSEGTELAAREWRPLVETPGGSYNSP
jgi:hypothetical protein